MRWAWGGQTNFSGSQRDQSLLPPSPPPTMGGPVDKDRSENLTLVSAMCFYAFFTI